VEYSVKKIAFSYFIASNPDLAGRMASLFKNAVYQFNTGFDFSWDIKNDFPSLRTKKGSFSFPAKPEKFAESKIIGGLLVVGDYNGSNVKNSTVNVSLELGYYFKRPNDAGEGKYQMVREIGSFDVKIGDDGSVSFVDDSNTKIISDEMIQLTDEVIQNPPDGALSRDKRFQKQLKLRDEYKEKEKLTRERNLADQEQAKKKYQSIESFVESLMDDDIEKYNFYDLVKLTETTGLERDQIVEQLKSYGLTSRTSSEILNIIKQIPKISSTRRIIRELLSIIRFI